MVKWRNQRGTISLGEYTMLIFLVIAVVMAMTTYVRRSLQARMRDARHYMISTVSKQCDSIGNCMEAAGINSDFSRIREQYEPYYQDVNSRVATDRDMRKGVWATDRGGTAFINSDGQMTARSTSKQVPPIKAPTETVLGGP